MTCLHAALNQAVAARLLGLNLARSDVAGWWAHRRRVVAV
ncbi:MAG: hypothetical protein AVDCRST_MAG19-4605 [uncultured Thermomicrobiales bacterium]|uniref:Uncharacterized protein n=1 Tax=uncultured Thermomicrobiales bacterium TaxID=1645740 RepID=A0A6J4VRE9_9BACT|nr:MAG: hypothetical protein AVDCRST_MAG19-4605 [uncultured Thermomicrobiales bacterium]